MAEQRRASEVEARSIQKATEYQWIAPMFKRHTTALLNIGLNRGTRVWPFPCRSCVWAARQEKRIAL
jgi:hypothetical protein